VPEYAAELEGGEQKVRGGAGVPVFRSSGPISLLLRPAHGVDTELGARAFAVAGHEAVEMAVEVVRLPRGVMRLKATTPAIVSKQTPRFTIAVVVAAPGWLANHASEVVLGPADSGAGWRRLTAILEIEKRERKEPP
jgi:hypothetical protein